MSRARTVVVHSPEQVPILLIPAGLGRRSAAFAIDSLVIASLIGLVTTLCRMLPTALELIVSATLGFLILWGYHVYGEVRHAGQTPGKRLLQLRVADARGLPVTLAQSMVRNVVRALDMLPLGGAGFFMTLVDPHGRRLGDIAADTLVVEELQPPPPNLRALKALRVNSLDTPRLRRLVRYQVGLEERELLLALCLRADALQEQVRYELFEAAGTRYRQRLRIDDPHLSGENLVRGLVALCYQQSA